MSTVTEMLNANSPFGTRERRRLYRELVTWIALNDGPGDKECHQLDHVASMVTVIMVSHVFEEEADKVARAVIRVRRKEKQHESKVS